MPILWKINLIVDDIDEHPEIKEKFGESGTKLTITGTVVKTDNLDYPRELHVKAADVEFTE